MLRVTHAYACIYVCFIIKDMILINTIVYKILNVYKILGFVFSSLSELELQDCKVI
jgi:hypothetical protein